MLSEDLSAEGFSESCGFEVCVVSAPVISLSPILSVMDLKNRL